MADLSPDEFMTRLGMRTQPLVMPWAAASQTLDEGSTSATPGFESLRRGDNEEEPLSILPGSESMVSRAEASLASSQNARPQMVPMLRGAMPDLMTKLGARPGVHFDFETGIPFLSRLASEREATPDEQYAALEHEYGKENVRKNAFGRAVVTTTDEKGKTVDLLANPIGLDTGDIATFMAQAPEMLGGLLPVLLTGGPGVLRAAATLALSAGGSEMAGAAKDMFRRWMEARETLPAEVAGRRTVQGVEQFIAGGALGALSKLEALRVSPFNTAGRLQFKSKEAARYLNEKFGGELEQTAAQATGSQILQAAEAMEAAKPGSRSAFSAFREKQLSEINRLKAIATGEVTDEEAMGKQVIRAAENKLAPLEYDVQLAAQEAEDAARGTIKAAAGTPVDKVAVGNSIDTRAKAIRDAFEKQNEANYRFLETNPLAKQPIVTPTGLEQEVKAFLADLPKVQKTVQQPTGVLGPNGVMTTAPARINVPIETPIRPKLTEFANKLEGGTVSINDLKQMRTDVNDAVNGGEALTGVKDGRLEHLGKMLTDAIDDGLAQINNNSLTSAWEHARDFYKTGIAKFEKSGIAELFREPANAIGPTELVERAQRSPDVYAAYKEFFGADAIAAFTRNATDSWESR